MGIERGLAVAGGASAEQGADLGEAAAEGSHRWPLGALLAVDVHHRHLSAVGGGGVQPAPARKPEGDTGVALYLSRGPGLVRRTRRRGSTSRRPGRCSAAAPRDRRACDGGWLPRWGRRPRPRRRPRGRAARAGAREGGARGRAPYTSTLRPRESERPCARSPGRDGETWRSWSAWRWWQWGSVAYLGTGGAHPARVDPGADRRAPRRLGVRWPATSATGCTPCTSRCWWRCSARWAALRGVFQLPRTDRRQRTRPGSGDHRAVPDLGPLHRLRGDRGPVVHRRPPSAGRAELRRNPMALAVRVHTPGGPEAMVAGGRGRAASRAWRGHRASHRDGAELHRRLPAQRALQGPAPQRPGAGGGGGGDRGRLRRPRGEGRRAGGLRRRRSRGVRRVPELSRRPAGSDSRRSERRGGGGIAAEGPHHLVPGVADLPGPEGPDRPGPCRSGRGGPAALPVAATPRATVIGTVGTEAKAELARGAGCSDPFVLTEQTRGQLVERCGR